MTTIAEYSSTLESYTERATANLAAGNTNTRELGGILETVYVQELTLKSLRKKERATLKGEDSDAQLEETFSAWYKSLDLHKVNVSRKRAYYRKLTALAGLGLTDSLLSTVSERASRVIPEDDISSELATAIESTFAKGVKLTERNLTDILTGLGIVDGAEEDEDETSSGGEGGDGGSGEDDGADMDTPAQEWQSHVNAMRALLEGGYVPDSVAVREVTKLASELIPSKV